MESTHHEAETTERTSHKLRPLKTSDIGTARYSLQNTQGFRNTSKHHKTIKYSVCLKKEVEPWEIKNRTVKSKREKKDALKIKHRWREIELKMYLIKLSSTVNSGKETRKW